MKIILKKHLEQYFLLQKKIDFYSEKLSKEHKNQMQCKKGCDMCCMDYSIFPVEFYSILYDFRTKNIIPKISVEQKENVCIFLKEGVCSIYQQRPIICRTHGLPLLFMNDNSEWELSACELNFTEFDFGEFSLDNTFPQDKFNSKLFLLNKKFITEFKEEEFSEFDLIPLKKLKEYF